MGHFLSPFLWFIKTMSSVLGNVLYTSSHCIPVKEDTAERKQEVGNYIENIQGERDS